MQEEEEGKSEDDVEAAFGSLPQTRGFMVKPDEEYKE